MKNKRNKYTADNHTFVICAYGQSRFLEECILSLLHQNEKSTLLIATSTINPYIENMARKYGIPLCINPISAGIASDWNYAYTQADSKLVTIVHQDDIYLPEYLERIIEEINHTSSPLIAFSDYCELRGKIVQKNNRLLFIKRIMLLPLRIRGFQSKYLFKRFVISFGNGICCPTVTYIKSKLPQIVFEDVYKSNIDWLAWERLSHFEGAFVYCHDKLVCHRIHIESTTTSLIGNQGRTKEDFDMLCRFWPRQVAYVLGLLYKKGEKSNNIDK